MPKIETIELKQMRVIENENGYETEFYNERKFPAAITNHSLSMGEKLGLIKGSQITDLGDIDKVFRAALDPKANKQEALEGVDVTRYLKVIYLAIIGVNPNLQLTYDEFTELYHEDTATTIDIYVSLVLNSLNKDTNKFAKGLQDSTKKK